MKDYKRQVTLNQVDQLVKFAINHNYKIIEEQGTLNDFYVIFSKNINEEIHGKTETGIKINNIKPRKYIVIYYEFETSWSNKLYMLHTDNLEKVIELSEKFQCDIEKIA